MRPAVALVINLLQDVNILRPLAYLAADDLGVAPLLLATSSFRRRDADGLWGEALAHIQADTGAAFVEIGSPWDLWRALEGRRGVLASGSESDLPNHRETHTLLEAAPPGFVTMTLQHGYECVGFLMNRNHRASHGESVGFAADLVCGWTGLSHLREMRPVGRSRVVVTGPSACIARTSKRALQPPRPDAAVPAAGIICENLHSPRFGHGDDGRNAFLHEFEAFAAHLAQQSRRVTLRPHPGGQYVLKKQVALPANVDVERRPAYELDWGGYAYGLSAPSSVIVDMVLAGIPVAVWQDEQAAVDARSYDGLTTVSSLDGWLAFERDVRLRPSMLLQRQARFLEASGLVVDPDEVRARYSRVLSAALGA